MASVSSMFVVVDKQKCRLKDQKEASPVVTELSFGFVEGRLSHEDQGAWMTESITVAGILVSNIINKSTCIVGLQFSTPNAIFHQLYQFLVCTNTCVSDAWCSHVRQQ